MVQSCYPLGFQTSVKLASMCHQPLQILYHMTHMVAKSNHIDTGWCMAFFCWRYLLTMLKVLFIITTIASLLNFNNVFRQKLQLEYIVFAPFKTKLPLWVKSCKCFEQMSPLQTTVQYIFRISKSTVTIWKIQYYKR